MCDSLAKYGVPPLFAQARLDDFGDEVRGALGDLEAGDGYLLCGATGRGKTHLAAAVLREWIATGHASRMRRYALREEAEISAWFCELPGLLAEIRRSFGDRENGGRNERALVKPLREARALVLDDLGAERVSAWTLSVVYEVVNHRLARLMPTIVTTNVSIDDIHGWDPRIASRLASLAIVRLEGPDRRLERARAGKTPKPRARKPAPKQERSD